MITWIDIIMNKVMSDTDNQKIVTIYRIIIEMDIILVGVMIAVDRQGTLRFIATV
ncbi:hypothetical protein D3C81_913750 [compost metagenome]